MSSANRDASVASAPRAMRDAYPHEKAKELMAALDVLITGTNSGFGRLTALALARLGHRVFAGMRDSQSRNEDAARSLAAEGAGKITVVDLDVTRDASVDAAIRQTGPIDVLVNNAAYVVNGLLETVTPADLEAQFAVNVFGVQRVTRAVLPAMHAKKKGLVIHVSSGVGRVIVPGMGAYVASKHALEAMADVYRAELAGTGIDTVVVQPGPFPTGITSKFVVGSDPARGAAYGDLAEKVASNQRSAFQQVFAAPDAPRSEEVSAAIVELVEAAPGARPARVVVDRHWGAPVRAINKALEEIAAQVK